MRSFLSNIFYYNEQVDVSYQQGKNYILQYLYFVTLYLKTTKKYGPSYTI